jgi:type I restriction enzyme S subunit
MKKGWETKKLGEVCEFEGGSQPPKSQFIYEPRPGYVRFLQIRDFGSDKNITFIPESKKNRLCSEDDTMIGRYGASVGKILTGKAGAYNVALMKTIPNLGILRREWFHSYLLSDEFQERLMNVAARSAQDGFSKEDIYNFPVPVPPLADQERIVGVLDEAFAGLATAQAHAAQNLQNARALFESHLQSVFTHRGKGWVETTIGDQVQLQRGFDITKEQQRPGNVPVVSSGGIKSFHDTAMVRAPGVVMGRKGTLGKVFYLEQDYWPHDTTLWVKDFKGNDPRFVYHFFTSLDVTGFDSGTANPALNRNQIHPLPVCWPPTAKQQELVTQLDALAGETQRLTRLYEQKQAALAALKKSLLHQAFTGEL